MKTTKFKNRIAQLLTAVALLAGNAAYAQDGAQAIDAATSELTGYVDPITSFVMIIGGLIAIVGGIYVVRKWNANAPETKDLAIGWFASLVFLVLMPLIVRTFVGI